MEIKEVFNIVICIGTILLIMVLVYRRKGYHSIVKTIILICAILVFPITLTVIVILAPGASVYAETGMLMLPYMNLLYVLPLTLLEFVVNEKEKRIIKDYPLFTPIIFLGCLWNRISFCFTLDI